MSTPRFAGKGSDISSCLCSISRSVFCKCTPLWIRTRCVQQIRESRSMFQLEAMELQCNQGGDWLGAPPRIPVIFGAYVYRAKNSQKITCSDYIFDNGCKYRSLNHYTRGRDGTADCFGATSQFLHSTTTSTIVSSSH